MAKSSYNWSFDIFLLVILDMGVAEIVVGGVDHHIIGIFW